MVRLIHINGPPGGWRAFRIDVGARQAPVELEWVESALGQLAVIAAARLAAVTVLVSASFDESYRMLMATLRADGWNMALGPVTERTGTPPIGGVTLDR